MKQNIRRQDWLIVLNWDLYFYEYKYACVQTLSIQSVLCTAGIFYKKKNTEYSAIFVIE